MPAQAQSEVETRSASPLGQTALTANGRIQPHGMPTRYWFEYGTTKKYGKKSDTFSLPPKLGAFYSESWEAGPAGWQGGMTGTDLVHHKEGGASGGFIRYSEPSGDDPNHVDGIGTLHLTSYFYPATHPNGDGLTVNFGGGDPDFRDARVSISVRGQEFEPNGAELLWWTQSDNDITKQFTPDWRRANWAYTGYTLTDALLSGKWEQVTYRLTNDSHAWTYGGHSVAQGRPNYAYDSINNSLGHLTCDFFHLLAFVNPQNRPAGSIDIDDITLAYRNYSLAYPDNGGKLIASPTGTTNDPATLTDGWRHGEGKMWESEKNPKTPQEFVYEFDHPVTIKSVQIHQHSEWPSQDVEVLTSDDGMDWKPLVHKTLPKDSLAGPNFAYLLERDLSQPAKYAKVRILSGYQAERWGLGEIEIFGDGAVYTTDDDWYHVNLDLNALKSGETYHYRVVAENDKGITHGSDVSFTIPADSKPHVVTTAPMRIAKTSATLTGRLTPMGKKSQFYFEYGTDAKYDTKTEEQYGGLQITPRSAFATIGDLMAGTVYHFRLVGVNDEGTTYGEDATFKTASE
ncbi:MAG: hypothetical protein ACKVT0_02395 [Planctomycetaceae bacterium]